MEQPFSSVTPLGFPQLCYPHLLHLTWHFPPFWWRIGHLYGNSLLFGSRRNRIASLSLSRFQCTGVPRSKRNLDNRPNQMRGFFSIWELFFLLVDKRFEEPVSFLIIILLACVFTMEKTWATQKIWWSNKEKGKRKNTR